MTVGELVELLKKQDQSAHVLCYSATPYPSEVIGIEKAWAEEGAVLVVSEFQPDD